MQPTLKQLKGSFKSITKGIKMRPLMQNLIIDESTIRCTDFQTYLVYKNTMELTEGMQSIDTLGLIDSVELNTDYPIEIYNRDHTSRDRCEMSTKELSYILKFVSKDETRLHLNGIAINNGHFVATDGHKLVKSVLGEVNDLDVIIPTEGLKTLLRLLKVHKLESFDFLVDIDFTVIDCEYFKLSIKNINREYPRWSAVILSKTSHSFVINNWIDFKNLKGLFKPINYSCKITILDGAVNLQIVGHDIFYQIGYTDDVLTEVNIGFNAMYLNDVINGNKITTFNFRNEYAPLKFNNDSGEGVIIPLKI